MDPDDTTERPPGKLRTWWHPLLVSLLASRLRDSCEVIGEVNVGRMPLRLDILLIRRLSVELPTIAILELRSICQRLNAYTLIEFKSPVDTLSRGDWNKLLGCAHLYVAQSESGIASTEVTLMILAPRWTISFGEEVRQSGCAVVEEERGIHRIDGALFRAYVIETDRLAGTAEPVLTVVSHEFIDHRRELIEELRVNHSEMVYYVLQQVEQFRRVLPDFEDSHMTEQMNQTLEELEDAILKRMPTERLLRVLPTEERLRGLPINEVFNSYSDDEIARAVADREAKKRKTQNETGTKE